MNQQSTLAYMLANNKQAIKIFKKYQSMFSALGDPQRQSIMFLLADGSRRSVVELAAETSLSRPAISHHLKILREARLVYTKQVGVRLYYSPMLQTPLKMSQDFTEVLQKVMKGKDNNA